MRKTAIVLLIVGCVWMILVCGFSYSQLHQPGSGIQWMKTTPPAEPLVSLKLGDNGEMLGQTADGILYEFSVYPDHIWKQVSEPSGSPPVGKICTSGNHDNSFVSDPPGKVKTRVSETCVYVETSYHVELSLLENGELWSWERADYAYTQVAVLSVLSVACVLGVLIIALGLVLLLVQMMKKKTS